ncbi:hypothetical protein P154DRAFT_571868 [Amniculicola lignicola CBS 123094]|uniref:Uncharacterized protein n=1 Tax=Amniculicola lignicola CBS 123094 TaxID=1392246 RepID=A0A6A5WU91_9PLEO|nr:hypothetical protein P154DRAFT_571868 [Amniculicola lignicola CBS 123094]
MEAEETIKEMGEAMTVEEDITGEEIFKEAEEDIIKEDIIKEAEEAEEAIKEVEATKEGEAITKMAEEITKGEMEIIWWEEEVIIVEEAMINEVEVTAIKTKLTIIEVMVTTKEAMVISKEVMGTKREVGEEDIIKKVEITLEEIEEVRIRGAVEIIEEGITKAEETMKVEVATTRTISTTMHYKNSSTKVTHCVTGRTLKREKLRVL